jgi:sugar phosphate isomerase/epimerase
MNAPAYGIFARVFPAGPASTVATSIATACYETAQLNLSALGLPTIPAADDWDEIDVDAIRLAFADACVGLWGLSCSYNMAHPDARVRSAGTTAAVALIARAPRLGVTAVTLCTGSRNPDRMWSTHPDNATPEAWADMRRELDVLLAAASDAGVLLGVEPEPGNVVRDADAASRLLGELGTDARSIGIIADSANLLSAVPHDEHAATLVHSFELLAPHIACLHAKDLVPWDQSLAGHGIVDYDLVGRLYSSLPQHPPLIVQDLQAADAARLRHHLGAIFG